MIKGSNLIKQTERYLKSVLKKKKISITESVVVAFMIAGTFFGLAQSAMAEMLEVWYGNIATPGRHGDGSKKTIALNPQADDAATIGVDNMGNGTVGIGYQALSSGNGSIAIGKLTRTTSAAVNSVAIGYESSVGYDYFGQPTNASDDGIVVLGAKNKAFRKDLNFASNKEYDEAKGYPVIPENNQKGSSTIIGYNNQVDGTNNIVVGRGYSTNNGALVGFSNVFLGNLADSTGLVVRGASIDGNFKVGIAPRYNVGIGSNLKYKGLAGTATRTVLIGNEATVENGEGNVVIGDLAYGRGKQTVVSGDKAAANDQGVAIGGDVYAAGKAAIAIGNDDLKTGDNVGAEFGVTLPYETIAKIYSPLVVNGLKYEAGSGTDGVVTNGTANNGFISYNDFIRGYVRSKYGDQRVFSPTMAGGRGAIAIGSRTVASEDLSTSIGALSFALAKGATTVGYLAYVDPSAKGGTAIGSNAYVFSKNSIAVGNKSEATSSGTVAYGFNSYAISPNSVVLGVSSVGGAKLVEDFKTTITGSYTALKNANIAAQSELMGLASSDNTLKAKLAEGLTASDFVTETNTNNGGLVEFTGYAVDNTKINNTFTNPTTNAKVKKIVKDLVDVRNGLLGAVSNKFDAKDGDALRENLEKTNVTKFTTSAGAINTIRVDGTNNVGAAVNGETLARNNIVVGNKSIANNANSLAIGYGTGVFGENSLGLGSFTYVSDTAKNSIGIGVTTSVEGADSFVAGTAASTTKSSTIVIGTGASSTASDSIVLGRGARAQAGTANANTIKNVIAVGTGAVSLAENTILVGSGANISENAVGSTVLGVGASSKGENSFVAGTGAISDSNSSVVIGKGSHAKINFQDKDPKNAGNRQNVILIGVDSETGEGTGNAVLLGSSSRIGKASGASIVVGNTTTVGDVTEVVTVGGKAYSIYETKDNGKVTYIADDGSIGETTAADVNNKRYAKINKTTKQGSSEVINTIQSVEMNTATQGGAFENVSVGVSGRIRAGSKNNFAGGTSTYIGAGVEDSIAIGTKAKIADTVKSGLAIGVNSVATKDRSGAIGTGAVANIENSFAIGVESKTDYDTKDLSKAGWTFPGAVSIPTSEATGIISVGSSTAERRIANVASGYRDTDAVNVAQIKSLYESIKLDIETLGGGTKFVSISKQGGETGQAYGVIQAKENFDQYVRLEGALLKIELRKRRGEKFDGTAVQAIEKKVAELKMALGNRFSPQLQAMERKLADIKRLGADVYRSDATGFDTQIGEVDKLIANANTAGVPNISASDLANALNDTNYNNNLAKGADSIAVGFKANTAENKDGKNGAQGVAVGFKATVEKQKGVAIGSETLAGGEYSIALGASSDAMNDNTKTRAVGDNSVAIGRDSKALGESSIALGNNITSGTVGTSGQKGASSTIAIGKNAAATGHASIAIGDIWPAGTNLQPDNLGARGVGAIAIGEKSIGATGDSSIALGSAARATSASAVAIGEEAEASGTNAIAFGSKNGNIKVSAAGNSSVALGHGAVVNSGATDALALGTKATVVAGATNGIALGTETSVTGANDVAIGAKKSNTATTATGNSVALGYGVTASGGSSVAIGDGANAEKPNSVAIGNNARAKGTNNNQIAIGNNSRANGDSAISIGNMWNGALDNNNKDGADGAYAVAIGGGNTKAIGDATLALGKDAQATAGSAIAIGSGTVASGEGALALGSINGTTQTTAVGARSLAFGSGAAVNSGANDSLALGTKATVNANANNSIALGTEANVTGANSIAIGAKNTGSGGTATTADNQAVAIGYGARALRTNSVAIGTGANVNITGETSPTAGVAIGLNATVTGNKASVVIGRFSKANQGDGVGFYYGLDDNAVRRTITDLSGAIHSPTEGEFAIGDVSGSSPYTRRITGLAAGRADTDAVNVSQLKHLGNTGLQFGADKPKVDGGTNPVTAAIGKTVEIKSADLTKVNRTDDSDKFKGINLRTQVSTNDGNALINIGLNEDLESLSIGRRNNRLSFGENNKVTLGNGSTASGDNAYAFGINSKALKNNAIAFGNNAIAGPENGEIHNQIAIGTLSRATGDEAISIGNLWDGTDAKKRGARGANSITLGTQYISAQGVNSIAIGKSTEALSNHAVAIGGETGSPETSRTRAIGAGSVALGANAVSGKLKQNPDAMDEMIPDEAVNNTIAIGKEAEAISTEAIAIGNTAGDGSGARKVKADGARAIAIGNGAQTVTNDSIAFGSNANITNAGTEGIAIGKKATVAANKGIALGSFDDNSGILTGAQRAIAIGTGATINNVKAANITSNGNNAVTTGQLADLAGKVGIEIDKTGFKAPTFVAVTAGDKGTGSTTTVTGAVKDLITAVNKGRIFTADNQEDSSTDKKKVTKQLGEILAIETGDFKIKDNKVSTESTAVEYTQELILNL